MKISKQELQAKENQKFEYAKKIILSCRTYDHLIACIQLRRILPEKSKEIKGWIDYQQKIIDMKQEYYSKNRSYDKKFA